MAWARHGHGMGATWAWHGMASVNQTRPLRVNQMGKIHSKPLAVRHGRGTAWARHGHGMGTVWARNVTCDRPLNDQLD